MNQAEEEEETRRSPKEKEHSMQQRSLPIASEQSNLISEDPAHQKRSSVLRPRSLSMASEHSMEFQAVFEVNHPSPPVQRLKSLSIASDESTQELVDFGDPHHQKGSSALGEKSSFRASKKSKETHILMKGEILEKLKSDLNKKVQCLHEGSTRHQDTRTLLRKIFVDLYITEGRSGDIKKGHEMSYIETTYSRLPSAEMQIKCNDIFKPLPEQNKHIRTVLTKGVAGIGKTVSVQKFILDWTEREANTDIDLVFPLPFRELNLMKGRNLSLKDLLGNFFPVTKEGDIFSEKYNILFIFDGLDECHLSLDCQKNVSLSDVTESASLEVLMTNLFMGNLLPSAFIWITSRPAAVDQIPSKYIDRMTEVLGFNDSQKEEYFMKRISDLSLANEIITHMKSSRTLFAMCQIPVFCWIAASVLERTISEGEIPKTLTNMYTHFLSNQTKKQKIKDAMLLKLGQLAFHQLMKGNLIFYEEDLKDCGIDVSEASELSMVCNEVFKEETGLDSKKVYTFIHLSIQEHLAAIYAHLTFVMHNEIVLTPKSLLFNLQTCTTKEFTIFDLHKIAVDKALTDKNGHLDLFLRFLLGLSLESNQALLQDMVALTGSSFHNNEKTVDYLKKKISENPPGERYINLFHCLNELDSISMVTEIQTYLKEGKIKQAKLSSSDWSALVFLLTSVEDLDEFDLSNYTPEHMNSEEVLLKLLPVVKACKAANLKCCNLTRKSCATLNTVLRSGASNLRDLNLSWNNLEDSGVNLLSAGLGHADCKLATLRMASCDLGHESCQALASAMISNPSHLRQLDLFQNNLGDNGVKQLCAGLQNPNCKLEILKLIRCKVEVGGCSALALALNSNPSHLKELDLSENELGDSGVKQLSPFLGNPLSKLESLRLWGCGITEESCATLASVLRSNLAHLKQLDLSMNKILDSGLKLLCEELMQPTCKIEILRLRYCGITDEGCIALVSAFKPNPSHLKELNLSGNKLNEGIKEMFALRDDPDSRLQKVTFYVE